MAFGGVAIPTAQQIQAQAHALAVRSVAGQVAAVRQAQQDAIRQAAQRAAQIQAASLAGAKYIRGLGLGTAATNAYANAVKNETGIASGYTGQLRTDADTAAQAAQASLASIPGNTQTITNHGDSLANVLYGLTGAIPANTLQVAGLGAAAAARALPAQTLGYGQQQAYGELGAGRTAAANLASQILSARAQLPSIQNQYAGQLTSYANTAADNARQQAALDSLIGQRNQPKIVSSGGGIYEVPVGGGAVTTLKQPKASNGGSTRIYGTAATGYFRLGKDGTPVSVKGPAAKKSSGGRLTAGQLQKATASANQAATAMRHGGTDKAGNPVKPIDFTTAVNEMRAAGYFVTPQLGRVAIDALKAAYGSQEAGIFGGMVAGPAGPPAA